MRIVQLIDRTPFYYERLSVLSTGVSRPLQAYREDSKAVFLTVEDNNIRYRIDGGEPDADEGHLVYATGNLWLADPKAIRNLRMIGSGGNAVVVATYYK